MLNMLGQVFFQSEKLYGVISDIVLQADHAYEEEWTLRKYLLRNWFSDLNSLERRNFYKLKVLIEKIGIFKSLKRIFAANCAWHFPDILTWSPVRTIKRYWAAEARGPNVKIERIHGSPTLVPTAAIPFEIFWNGT